MKVTKLILGISILVQALSCSNQKGPNNFNEVYPINLHESINPPESAEEWIEGMEFVPLETNPDCYLASRMWYDVSETHIAVSSNNAIHIYERSGKHINSFKKEGKGPGEYVRIYQIRLMPKANEVMALDRNRKIMVYDFHGNSVQQIPIKYLVLDAVPVDSDMFACYIGRISRAYVKTELSDFDEDSSLYEFIYIDSQGDQISNYKSFKYPILGSFTKGNLTGPESPGQYYVNPAYTYEIYELGPGNHFELKYQFDYQDNSMDTSLLNNKTFMKSNKANSNIKGYKNLDHITVNENSIMFWAPNIDDDLYGFRLINRKTGNQRSVFMDSTQIIGKYHGVPIEFGKNSSGKWFIQKSEAIDILEKNPFSGTQIPKRLIPKEYNKFFKPDNLWKYDLNKTWRLIYWISSDDTGQITLLIDWMNHKQYDKLFGYSTS